jgi:hypothetical protein
MRTKLVTTPHLAISDDDHLELGYAQAARGAAAQQRSSEYGVIRNSAREAAGLVL